MSGVEFTDEEYEEFFGDAAELAPRPRSRWVLAVAALAVLGMFATGASAAFGIWRDRNLIRDAGSIVAASQDRVDDSEFGWLVSGIVVEPTNARVGAFVRNNPPDGVIHMSDRGWQPDDLRETVDHEIGHLLDFALYGDRRADPTAVTDTGQRLAPTAERRGGLESEVWAECYAVSTGERELDPASDTQLYRCSADDLEVLEAEMARATEICRPWGPPECRPLAG